ncbi:MAG: hypothetical protein U0271_48180 [Polyangiaceae bacterium]
MSPIPSAWRERTPLITERAFAGLERVLQHADAPKWNRQLGDRVGARDLEKLAAFRAAVASAPREVELRPSERITSFVDALRDRLFALEDLPRGFDVRRDFDELPTTDREAIARRLEELVPRDLPLDDAVVYSTSATTGHAVIVPSHPAAMVQNLAHLERAATLAGVALDPEEGVPFALNLTVQRQTYVFATTMSGWRGAVFVKANLAEHDWAGGGASRDRFLSELAPRFIASEPVTLARAIELGVELRPRLVVSSAVHLSIAQQASIERSWGTRVVDLYSTTETGPVAVRLPGSEAHVVLLPDLYVEALDARGNRVPDGERGELTVTGGRNPFLPLVRYRTGDYGRLGALTLRDGTVARAIFDLEGRAPVSFRAMDGSRVSSVDIARRLRPLAPFVQHALVQDRDGSIELRLKPMAGVPIPLEDFEYALHDIFGSDAVVSVRIDEALGAGGGKVVAWRVVS